MKNLGLVGAAIAALAIAGCGGGGSSPAPTIAPTPVPTPGQVTVAYTTTFGASGSAANASNIAFQAPTQTATLTVAQANYSGSFTAASSCAQVTVAPATSTGAFTVTAADATAAACTVTFTGNAGSGTGTLVATVPKPAGVVLRWYATGYQTQQNPVALANGPINVVGLGATFGTVLQVSEQNYVGGFPPAKVVTSAGCNGFIFFTAFSGTPTGLPATPAGASQVYYAVTGAAAILTTGGCTITASDSYVPLAPGVANPAVAIGVEITTLTGVFQ